MNKTRDLSGVRSSPANKKAVLLLREKSEKEGFNITGDSPVTQNTIKWQLGCPWRGGNHVAFLLFYAVP